MKKFIAYLSIFGLMASVCLFNFTYLFADKASAAGNAGDVPAIIARSSWDNSATTNQYLTWIPHSDTYTDPTSGIPDYSQPVRIVIHDLGCPTTLSDGSPNPTCNNDNENAVNILQDEYESQSSYRGWGDLGYNFVIDRQGNIYEGRYGGNGVRGAHLYQPFTCQNFNVNTIGIALMGNFEYTPVPQVMETSLAKLVGWLSYADNIDPTNDSLTTPEWTNPHDSSGSCTTTSGAFSSTFTGPALLTHRDVTPGNSDIPDTANPNSNGQSEIDLATIRQEAGVYKNEDKNDVFQVSGDSNYYVISNGTIEKTSNIAGKQVVKISKTQLDYFKSSSIPSYPNNTVLKSTSDNLYYVILNGTKELVTASQLAQMGLSAGSAVSISPRDLAQINDYNEPNKPAQSVGTTTPSSPSAPATGPNQKLNVTSVQNGELIEENNDGVIYVVANNKKQHIASAALFSYLNYSWSNIDNIPSSLFNTVPTGAPLTFPNNTLIKGSAPTVYLVQNGMIEPILNEDLFNTMGYSFSKVMQTTDSDLKNYNLGQPVMFPNNSLLGDSSNGQVYLIYGGKKYWITSASLFNQIGLNWKSIFSVPDSYLTYYATGNNLGSVSDYKIVTGQISSSDQTAQETRSTTGTSTGISTGTSTSATIITGPSTTSASANQIPTLAITPSNLLSSYNLPSQNGIPLIKIAIYSPENTPASGSIKNWSSDQVTVTANGAYSVYSNNNLVSKKNAGDTTTISTTGPLTNINFKLVPSSPSTVFTVTSYNAPNYLYGKSTYTQADNYNQFLGNIIVQYSTVSQKVWVVNQLDLEDYVKGIGEVPDGNPAQFEETMLTAARTYGLYNLINTNKYPGEVYNLTNNASSQVYDGYGFEALSPSIAAAANATDGVVGTYNNSIILAAYSSDSGGVTKSACAVWGLCSPNYSYLQGGVQDPSNTDHNQSAIAASHGVGISAVGALQMALNGNTYNQILPYYYPGISLSKVY